MPEQRLSADQVSKLAEEYVELPDDYLSHLMKHGWGTQENGRRLYEGPVSATTIYGTDTPTPNVFVLGDDGMGYCLAYDPTTHGYGELSPGGEWEPWPLDQRLASYLS